VDIEEEDRSPIVEGRKTRLISDRFLCCSNWIDLWSLLSDECKNELLMIEYNKFMDAILLYLEKHRSVCITESSRSMTNVRAVDTLTPQFEELDEAGISYPPSLGLQ